MERISEETIHVIRGMAASNEGADRRHHCPECRDTRKNKHDRSFSVRIEGSGILFNCWHCGFKGAIPSHDNRRDHSLQPQSQRTKVNGHSIPTPSEVELEMAYQWLSKRGITRSTARSVHIVAGIQFIKGEMQHAIGFAYGGDPTHPDAVKWRATASKAFTQSGSAQTFWLAERLQQGDPVVITEGEMDALSLLQAGIKAVSVPNGAPAVAGGHVTQGHDPSTSRTARGTGMLPGAIQPVDGKFSYIWHAKDLIEKAPRIVIAVDSDDPGNALGEEIARRIGRAKCWRAFWPDGCKDANDVLVQHGADVLRECIENAKPWPVKGLYEANHFLDKVMALYDKGYAKGLSTGFDNVDEIYTVVPGQLTVVTGIPGHGKSTFLDNILVSLAKKNQQRFAVCSFENPPEVHIAKLAAIGAAKPFFDGPTRRMERTGIEPAIRKANEHFIFLHQSDGSLSSLDEIIDLAKAAVMRYGINGLVLDPYNYLDRGVANETDWVSDALTKLKLFAMAHDCHVWLVAHPTKIRRREDGSTPIPTGYDIAGCYSNDTEVMTRNGWIKHSQIRLTDEVACFDTKTKNMVYARPSHIICKEYDGPIHHLKGYGYDLLVTPEHRMVVEPYWKEPMSSGLGRPIRWRKGEWSFCEIQNLPKAQFNIPLSAPLMERGESYVSLNMARIAGWYVAEGSKVSRGVSITQACGPLADSIEQLIIDLGISYTSSVHPPGGKGGKKKIKNFYIGIRQNRAIVSWLHSECGIGSANKMIPHAIRHGSPEHKAAFLETYLLGDGSIKRYGKSAVTTSRVLRDQIQQLCLELGLSCSWTYRDPVVSHHSSVWQINICQKKRNRTALLAANRTVEHYNGTVWCLTVPTGAYMVRRNGRATICGNSAHFYNKADMGITIHRPDLQSDQTEVHTWKVRFSFHGKIGKAKLTFDPPTGMYFAPVS